MMTSHMFLFFLIACSLLFVLFEKKKKKLFFFCFFWKTASGHRASGQQLASVCNMYGTTIPKSTLWRCQRLLKEGDANLNDDMWSVLPKWMKELAEGNPGTYWSVEHDADTKQFVRAILVLPTANIIRLCGRKITASDMCHSKNDNFEGTYAIGSYQLGS